MYCKLSSKNSGLLRLLCICKSSDRTIENNNNLTLLISVFLKLNNHLLILGDLIYPTKNEENCTTIFVAVTKYCFLHQHINNPIHARPDYDFRWPSDKLLVLLSPLGKSRHNVITFQYQLECTRSSKVGYNYHKANYTAIKRNLNDIDWQKSFQGKVVNLSWKTFLKLLNNIILKCKKFYLTKHSSFFQK